MITKIKNLLDRLFPNYRYLLGLSQPNVPKDAQIIYNVEELRRLGIKKTYCLIHCKVFSLRHFRHVYGKAWVVGKTIHFYGRASCDIPVGRRAKVLAK